MRIHWMYPHSGNNLNDLRKLAETANECGYYSVLITYHSLTSDAWVKCANTINLEHKFKYFLAIRTYAISPEYFVMMYKAFNEIQKNRIMFNIVAGDIQESESSVDNIILNKEYFDTVEKRVEYTYKWMEKMVSLLSPEDMPEIVMSGTSEKTLHSASCFANYNLSMMNDYLDNPSKFKKNKNRMVCAAVKISDSYEEAEKFIDNLPLKHQKKWTIFGTEENVKQKMIELKQAGVTDILLRARPGDPEFYLVHDFVKKHNGIIN